MAERKPMTAGQRIRRAWGEFTGRPIREAAMSVYDDPDLGLRYDQGGSEYYTPLSKSKRDLTPLDRRRAIEIAAYLYMANPLARRVIDLRVQYILGEGVHIECEDQAVQDWVDNFWSDHYNRMDIRLSGLVRASRLYGELCIPVVVNRENGAVRIGFVPPEMVNDVVTAPNNSDDPIQLILAPKTFGTKDRVRQVVRLDDNPESETFGMLAGDTLWFTFNKLPDQKRGVGDLYSIADYLDGYEAMMWDTVERAAVVNSMIYHVILTGMTEAEVEVWWTKNGAGRAPKSLSVLATNEKVEWKQLAPSFASQDLAGWSDLILSMIATGVSVPKVWLNSNDDPSRAVAAELTGPALKGLSEMQREFSSMLSVMMRFVIDQGRLYGSLPENVNGSFRVVTPELGTDAFSTFADKLQVTAQALGTMKEAKLIDQGNAVAVVAMVLSRLGIEVTAKELLAAIEAGAEEAHPEVLKRTT